MARYVWSPSPSAVASDSQVAGLVSNPTSETAAALKAASVAAVEAEATVSPDGAWDFTSRPEVAGAPLTTVLVDGSPVPMLDVDPTPVTAASLGAMQLHLDGYGDWLANGETIVQRRLVRNDAVAPGSGSLRFTYFRARKTEAINTVRLYTGGTAGAGLTLARVGIYAEDGSGNLTLVASTANDTTLFGAAFTSYNGALQAPWSKTANARYALGLLVVGTTAPTFYGLPTQAPGLPSDEMAVSPRLTGLLSSQADLPASVPGNSVVTSGQGAIYARLIV